MEKQLKQLIEWHEKFEVPYRTKPSIEYLGDALIKLRARIMIEEVKEWESAAENEMLVADRAKELVDILYTVIGTVITEGLQDYIVRAFDAVHESNLSKLGADGKPFKRADGKVLKGENYIEPDLSFLDSITPISA